MTRVSRPHVLASAAVSLDGVLDDATPQRLVLSGPADLDRVDAERAGVDAILVGAGTVRADDPRLLVRSPARREAREAAGRTPSPLRVVLAGGTRLPVDARVLTLAGAETLVLDGSDPAAVLDALAARGVVRLMIEGGATVLRAFLGAGLVDELQLVVAPRLVGEGPRFTGAPAALHLVETRPLGPDVLLRYRLGHADDRWLAEACALAERCPPSPTAFAVGAVVVGAGGEVLATGWSRRDDPHDHAEEAALRGLAPADPRLRGATVYSSLEPCGQRASRPVTCARRIVDAGIGRVVMAWREPPTFVGAPSGAAQLEAAGVEVVELPRWADLARRPNPRS